MALNILTIIVPVYIYGGGRNNFDVPLAGVGTENRDFFGSSNDNERNKCHCGPKKSRLLQLYSVF
jgi:hypothetical protein